MTPKFSVGDVVHTKATVRVLWANPRGGRFLSLLPGAEWVVVAVLPPEPRQRRHNYRIRCAPYEVIRSESSLRFVRRPQGVTP